MSLSYWRLRLDINKNQSLAYFPDSYCLSNQHTRIKSHNSCVSRMGQTTHDGCSLRAQTIRPDQPLWSFTWTFLIFTLILFLTTRGSWSPYFGVTVCLLGEVRAEKCSLSLKVVKVCPIFWTNNGEQMINPSLTYCLFLNERILCSQQNASSLINE